MRVSTASTYRRVLMGLRQNQLASARAQEQLASGRRLLRASDDPTGASRAARLEHRLGDVARYRSAIEAGRRTLDTASSALTDVSTLLADVRALLLQGMNGVLTDDDRKGIAAEIEELRGQMIALAEQRSGDQYVFGGTRTESSPWREVVAGGRQRVEYTGDEHSLTVRVGHRTEVETTLPGSEVLGRFEPDGAAIGGLTGARLGTSTNQGTGYAYVDFRHDATDPGALASVGLALVQGGDLDTILSTNDLAIDATAGTIRLGSGPAVALPTGPETDFVVRNELGGELHLDFTGYTGADYAGVVTGSGSASLDGTTYTPLTFTETDLELIDPARKTVVHLDTTAVKRAGEEQVEFRGTTNVFDLLSTMAEELRNVDGLDTGTQLQRFERRLEDLDRHHRNVLVGTGVLGARSQRLGFTDERALDLELEGRKLLSDVTDADLSEVAIDLQRSDFLLQLAQASGARILQTSLLNFLG